MGLFGHDYLTFEIDRLPKKPLFARDDYQGIGTFAKGHGRIRFSHALSSMREATANYCALLIIYIDTTVIRAGIYSLAINKANSIKGIIRCHFKWSVVLLLYFPTNRFWNIKEFIELTIINLMHFIVFDNAWTIAEDDRFVFSSGNIKNSNLIRFIN